jgi:hypothetical protein
MDDCGIAQARNDGFSAVTYSVAHVSRLARLIASSRNATRRLGSRRSL